MNIALIGTGYVGLVSGVCLALHGNKVICVDNNPKVIEKLQSGVCTIYEPGLEKELQLAIKKGVVRFTTNTIEAVQKSEVIFLCLPTPQGEDGSADLSYIVAVTKQIAPYLKDKQIIVNKSTVPVGTGEIIEQMIKEVHSNLTFSVVSNPEFLKEGFAVEDFNHPDRVVIGGDQPWALEALTTLYTPFTKNIIKTDRRSSEMIKYAANSFLATKISFMNEIANLCEKVGANVDMVKSGIGSDPRIGSQFLNPGIGYGGSCFPKDISALISTAYQQQYQFKILDTVNQVNEIQKGLFVSKIAKHFNFNTGGLKLAIWGLTFKKNTDDVRASPTIEVIKSLVRSGFDITAYDPQGMDNFKIYLPNIKINYVNTKEECLKAADGLVVLTEWDEFKNVEFETLKKLMRKLVIFDGRNLLDRKECKENGFDYYGVGR
jgi:UDPglucose 6-dehydrogenase